MLIQSRRRLALWLLALSLPAAVALGSAGCGSSATGSGGGNGCVDKPGDECLVGYICVAKCGGPVIHSGCCPCTDGTVDSSTCSDGGTGGSASSSGTGGATPQGTTVVLNGVECLDFATEALDVANPCMGDIVFLQGINVDLQSNGSASTFCPQPGTFQSLASIPADYSACAWESYVEGAVGLAKTGYVVRDTAGAHHYRFWIIDDQSSTITFQLAKID
jgi:hypothetical protein